MSVNETQNQWWRWPLMPIVVVAGSFLGSIILPLFYWFSLKLGGGFYEDGWMFLYIIPTISSVAFGALWANISYQVSPTGKLTAATVMVTILAAVCALALLVVWVYSNRDLGDEIFRTIQLAAVVLASIISLISTHSGY